MGLAEYAARQLKRGSSSILESPHFKDLINNQGTAKLRKSYYGVKEWYLLARSQMERQSSSSLNFDDIVREAKKNEDSYPPGYPFMPVESDSPEKAEERKTLWQKFRHLAATVYPSSPYAIEERVIDEWNYFCDGKSSSAETPPVHVKGGVPIKLYNEFPQRQSTLLGKDDKELLFSNHAYALYERLHRNCNPWRPTAASDTMPASFVTEFLDSIETKADATLLLPEVLLRWRWLSSGGSHYNYSQLSTEETSRVIDKICQLNLAPVAVHLLRHKVAFKLSPNVQAFEQIFQSLMLLHWQQSQQSDLCVKPEPNSEPEPKDSFSYTGRRRVARSKFPFRQVPRFYFYKPLAFVPYPEPALFSEFALPRLPTDNDTKRLLPDDQRKRLHIMIRDQEKLAQWYQQQTAESVAMSTLTDMYRLYHYMTSQNTRYYSLTPTPVVNDSLVLAGALGGQVEGWERSRQIGETVLGCESLGGQQITASGLCGLLLGSCLHPDKAMGVQQVLEQWINMPTSQRKDSLEVGGFIPLLAALRNSGLSLPQVNSGRSDCALGRAIGQTVKPLVDNACATGNPETQKLLQTLYRTAVPKIE